MSSLFASSLPSMSPQIVTFSVALSLLLSHEGGFVNDPVDQGGATKEGVSLRFLRVQGYIDGDVDKDGDIDAEDVKKLSVAQVAEIYKDGFWDKNNIGQLKSQRLANMFFGMSANMGNKRAAELLQRAVNVYNQHKEPLKIDGDCGTVTIAAINECLPHTLLRLYQQECEIFYRSLVRQHPMQMRFLKGWLNRLNSY